MDIDYEHKIVFIRNPKTGTKSFSKALNLTKYFIGINNYFDEQTKVNEKSKDSFHFTMNEAIEYLKNNDYDPKKFEYITLVRNPFDRMKSYFRFAKPNNYGNPSYSTREMCEPHADLRRATFEEFIHMIGDGLFRNNRPWFKIMVPYKLEEIMKVNNEYNAKIFKYENMVECTKYIESRIGEKLLLQTIGKSKPNVFESEYTSEMTKIIEKEYEYEIKRFYS